jgi:4-amino-4-deoxy-L-arabinose transferase-like glycosyltransferase
MRSKKSPSIFQEMIVIQHQQESHYRFTLELGLFAVLLFVSYMVRIHNLSYNTLFLDEAINVVVGEDLLQGNFSRNAIAFHFGSYLYPAVSAIINRMGGVETIRLASTLLMCLTAIFIYLTTRDLFGRKASLLGMMLFSFNGNILNLGQLAVYDALALPFLAASLYLLVAATASEQNQRRFLVAASVCAILATLSKYIGLIYLPALFITALALFLWRGIPMRPAIRSLFIYFVLPVVQVLGFYGAFYHRELVQVYQEQQFFSLAPRSIILEIIDQEIGIITLLALMGLALLGFAIAHNRDLNTQPLSRSDRARFNWRTFPPAYRILLFALLSLLLCTWLAAPLQHWFTANSRSLWKHCAYSLIFLCPLAGYCVARVVDSLRPRNRVVNAIGIVFLCAGTLYFADRALDSNWLFRESWPNAEQVVSYLRNAGLSDNSRVLAEDMDIYEYYFASEIDNRQVWNNFWYMEYGGKSGQEGALAAIHDRAFDFIIVEDYYFPGIRERINPILSEAGYVVGWQEEQKLRAGDTILLQVFIPSDGGSP